MTRLHKLAKYRDGFKLIEYCPVCSAEGDALRELCPGNFPDPVKVIVFQDLSQAEFDEKYEKALDDAKPKPINSVIENNAG